MIDTAVWFRAAYIVVAVVYVGYTISLFMRSRRTVSRYEQLRARRGSSTS